MYYSFELLRPSKEEALFNEFLSGRHEKLLEATGYLTYHGEAYSDLDDDSLSVECKKLMDRRLGISFRIKAKENNKVIWQETYGRNGSIKKEWINERKD